LSHTLTCYRWDGQSKLIIDYVITKEIRNILTNVSVLPGINFRSDYRLLVADFKKMKRQATSA
jgi:hypothetical protein